MLWSQSSAIFAHFRRKQLAFFSKTNVMIKFLQKLAVVLGKKATIFSPIFSAKIFQKIIASVPGVDVMITILCDFCQFSAKKLAFLSKTNVMIKILPNLNLF
jgi:hypothetical protein